MTAANSNIEANNDLTREWASEALMLVMKDLRQRAEWDQLSERERLAILDKLPKLLPGLEVKDKDPGVQLVIDIGDVPLARYAISRARPQTDVVDVAPKAAPLDAPEPKYGSSGKTAGAKPPQQPEPSGDDTTEKLDDLVRVSEIVEPEPPQDFKRQGEEFLLMLDMEPAIDPAKTARAAKKLRKQGIIP